MPALAAAVPPTTIAEVEFTPLDLALHVPFGIAGGAQDLARNVLVRVTLADGTEGIGEAAPFPAYNGETQAQALAALASVRPWLADGTTDAARWRASARRFAAEAQPASGAALAALETALLDALTRRAGLSLWAWCGGAAAPELETDITITTGTADEAGAAAARHVRDGFRTLKIKVGGSAAKPGHDLARLAAIRDAAPGVALILDGNAGLTRAGARDLLAGLYDLGEAPALLEQWLPADDTAGARALCAEVPRGTRVAADEAVCTAADAYALASAGAAHVLNIKLMKAGLAEAFDIAAVARATGMGLMIGGNVESVLAMSTAAHIATGLGGFTFVDLDTPLFLATNPFTGGMQFGPGGRITWDTGATGHGVSAPRNSEQVGRR